MAAAVARAELLHCAAAEQVEGPNPQSKYAWLRKAELRQEEEEWKEEEVLRHPLLENPRRRTMNRHQSVRRRVR